MRSFIYFCFYGFAKPKTQGTQNQTPLASGCLNFPFLRGTLWRFTLANRRCSENDWR